MSSCWGVNRTMARIHALLLISAEPLCSNTIRDQLDISKGNANMNIHALLDWHLIFKQHREGERSEYYMADKDMWSIFRKIITQRKKKELEPMLDTLKEFSEIKNECRQSEEFCKVVDDILLFSQKAECSLNRLVQTESNWFLNNFIKMIH